MNAPEYPLADSTWDVEELDAMQEVISSGRFTMDGRVRAFEEQCALHFGAKHAVMVNSGSSANLVACAALALEGDGTAFQTDSEIIVPAVSWPTTYYPWCQYGARLRFVDIDPRTLNIDINQVEATINKKTAAIVAVNLLGNPSRLDLLTQIASSSGVPLVEDNCESMGASLNGKQCGTFGVLGTLSTFFSHHISTMEGGIVLTDSLELAERMACLRAHGWTRELPVDNTVFPKTGTDFDDLFRFVLPGYNLRPTELSGAIGIEQLRKLDRFVEARRKNAQKFCDAFAEIEGVETQLETGHSSWFGFAMVLTGKLAGKRNDLARALSIAGIESRPIVAGNFARNPVLKRLNVAELPPLPAADSIDENGLFVGNHHYDISAGIERLAETVASFAAGCR